MDRDRMMEEIAHPPEKFLFGSLDFGSLISMTAQEDSLRTY
jgi:hypothetical protein